MSEVVLHKQKDRVSVSYSRKINIGNYESVDVHAGYSTDLKKDETVEQAFDRADAVATEQLERFCEPLENARQQKGRKS